MALAELISSLKVKRRTQERSAFGRYLESVRSLAAGAEADADEIAVILESAGRSEDDLSRDVQTQTQRLSWHAQLMQGRQAAADRASAEKDLARAQQALQEAIDRLMPAVDAAQSRMQTADQVGLYTQQAEHRLTETVLDAELLEREAAVVRQLSDVNAELNPLLQDRDHKRHSLGSAEFTLEKLRSRKEGDWVPAGIALYFHQPKDIRELAERVDDLRDQVRQLDSAIQPRLAEQRRLQSELARIHAEKLTP